MEVWKDIDGYEGFYQVSNKGNVKSLNYRRMGVDHILSHGVHYKGYLYVNLQRCDSLQRFYVHRLVACAFIPNMHCKPQVNHIDENKKNNNVENLEWVTSGENMRHGTRAARCSKKNCKSAEGTNIETGEKMIIKTVIDAESLGLDKICINKCCRGERKSYMGYTWKFE